MLKLKMPSWSTRKVAKGLISVFLATVLLGDESD
jgi:hypothetical protein